MYMIKFILKTKCENPIINTKILNIILTLLSSISVFFSPTLKLKALRLPPVPADMVKDDLLLLPLRSPGGLSEPVLSDLPNCLGFVNLDRERERKKEEREEDIHVYLRKN